MEGEGAEAKGWKLKKESELRFEVEEGKTAVITLKSGTAEIFGVEMAEKTDYLFAGGSKGAVFTWYGCELTTAGHMASAYASSDTPMQAYTNLHQRLDARREEAEKAGGAGPRVMVVGPTDSGKSSLCRMLLSYAVRRGRKPIFVDLDVGQGNIAIPGVIAATPLEKRCLTVQDGFKNTSPLSYFYGATNLQDNPELFKRLVAKMGSALDSRVADSATRASGCVINTAGWVQGKGYALLVDAAKLLKVDVVLVMGQDKLHADLHRDLVDRAAAGDEVGAGGAGGTADGAGGAREVAVVKLPRSGGVVDRATKYRADTRDLRMKQYFFGKKDDEFMPATTVVSFDDVQLFRVGGIRITAGMVPIGTKPAVDPVSVTDVEVSPLITHTIFAVSYGTNKEDVAEANVAGFVHLQKVDMEERKLTFLSPVPGDLPSNVLVMGGPTMKWVD